MITRLVKVLSAERLGKITVAAIVTGALASVALAPQRADAQSLMSWGSNGYGQLGTNNTTNRSTPGTVRNLGSATAVAGGTYHSLAVLPDGTVWAWGLNSYGQLGDGTTTQRLTPVRVGTLTDVVAVAAGNNHSVALKRDGTVWAWGINGAGQLGDGTYETRLYPVQVVNLTNVVAIAAGGDCTLALRQDGTVWAWGDNEYGQLGDGTTIHRRRPIQVSTIRDIIAISVGARHSLALRQDGTVWAWGRNDTGQLGTGTDLPYPKLEPVQVPDLSGVVAIAAGGYHSLAVLSDTTVMAWGNGTYGQLGYGLTLPRIVPTPVSNLAGVSKVYAGIYYSMALMRDGTVYAWGQNSSGQLGNGNTNDKTTPVQVSNLNAVIALAAGGYHGLAAKLTPADLVVQSITMDKADRIYSLGERATALATIRNAGGVPSLPFTVSFFSHQPTAVSCGATGEFVSEQSALPPGASAVIPFSFNTTRNLGTYTLRVFVDALCATPESNELNNQATLNYYVPYNNDDCTGAVALSDNVTFTMSVAGATSVGDPGLSCGSITNNVWFTFTPSKTGTVTVSTCGSDFDTIVGVFTGMCGLLQEIACNNDACGLQSVVNFPGTAGTTYFIMAGRNRGTNATLRIVARVAPPDLAILSATLNKTQYSAGETGTMTAVIRNIGTNDTPTGFAVDFYRHAPSTVACGVTGDVSVSLPPLTAQATTTVVLPFTAPATMGTYTARVFADRVCIIDELSEANNQSTATYRVSGADLVVQSLSLNKTSFFSGELGTVTVVVKNQGSEATSGSFTVSVFANHPDPAVCGEVGDMTYNQPALAPGGSATIRMSFFAAYNAGTNTLRAFVNSTCEIPELSLDNNQATLSYVSSANNDFCVGAIPLANGVSITQRADNATASGDPDPSCNFTQTQSGTITIRTDYPIQSSVWYAYTPSCTGSVSVNVSARGSNPLRLMATALSGACGGTLTELDCDFTPGESTAPQVAVSFMGRAGVTTYILVGRNGGTDVTYTVTANQVTPLVPDLAVESVVLNKATYTPGETATATVTVKNEGCGNAAAFAVDLYALAPAPVGCGSLQDVRVNRPPLPSGSTDTFSVPFTIPTSTVGAQTLRAFADAACAVAEAIELNNQSTFAYYIAMPSNNDLCVGALPIVEGSTFTMNTAFATGQGDSGPTCFTPTKGVWFTFVPTCTGNVTVSTDGSDFTPNVAVFTGNCGNLTQIACGGNGLGFLGVGGTTYRILVNGNGTLRLRISVVQIPLPDLVVQSIVPDKTDYLPGEPGTVTVTVKNNGCGNTMVGFDVSVYGASTTTAACGAVGDSKSARSPLASGGTDTFTLAFTASTMPGPATVRVFADSECVLVEPVTANNQATASYTVEGPVLSNDLCVGAITLTTGATFTMNTASATAQGDVNPCFSTTKGVWFNYTPECTGTVTISTAGSDFTPQLAVMTGPCGNLTQVACSGSFMAVAGRTYRILANGSGTLRIRIEPVAILLPDLVVQSVTLNRTTYAPGETGTATLTVKNQGCGDTLVGYSAGVYPSAPETLSCGAANGFSANRPALVAGGTDTFEVAFTAPATLDAHVFRAYVNWDCALVESVTNNNQTTLSYTVVTGAPDLIVESAVLNKTAYTPREVGTVTITVRNVGNLDTGGAYYVDILRHQPSEAACNPTNYYKRISRPMLAPGATDTFIVQFANYSGEGVFVFRVFADSTCVVAEDNESNNQASITYSVASGPELVVQSATLNKTTFGPGEVGSVTISIKNWGVADSGAYHVDIYRHAPSTVGCDPVTPPYYKRIARASLAPGAVDTFTVPYVNYIGTGNFVFRVFADSLCVVPEGNEVNNQVKIYYKVAPPPVGPLSNDGTPTSP